MKQPIENDFDVQNHDAGVDVTFRPTKSQYSFLLLTDRRSVSPRASVRHGKCGDTGDYASGDVEATAFRVACAAIKGRQRPQPLAGTNRPNAGSHLRVGDLQRRRRIVCERRLVRNKLTPRASPRFYTAKTQTGHRPRDFVVTHHTGYP